MCQCSGILPHFEILLHPCHSADDNICKRGFGHALNNRRRVLPSNIKKLQKNQLICQHKDYEGRILCGILWAWATRGLRIRERHEIRFCKKSPLIAHKLCAQLENTMNLGSPACVFSLKSNIAEHHGALQEVVRVDSEGCSGMSGHAAVKRIFLSKHSSLLFIQKLVTRTFPTVTVNTLYSATKSHPSWFDFVVEFRGHTVQFPQSSWNHPQNSPFVIALMIVFFFRDVLCYRSLYSSASQ